MNKTARTIYEARKRKQPITANIRLKKNGRFSSVSGTVEDLRVSRDGFAYAVIKKASGEYQNVRLENILSVNKHDRS